MARRRHGSGEVRLRPDGRWEGRPWLADGGRKSVYARSRRELVTRLQEERWRLACGIPVPTHGLLLGQFFEQWLDVMRTRVRPRTFDAYELCSRRIERALGQAPLARLTPQSLQRTYSGMLAAGLSPRTVLQTHAVLHRP